MIDLSGGRSEDDNFRYTLENGAVRAVTLERSVENTEDWVWFPVDSITTAATALIWAQEDVPLWTFGRKALFSDLANADWENGFTLRGNGAVVTWEVESRNFTSAGTPGWPFQTTKRTTFSPSAAPSPWRDSAGAAVSRPSHERSGDSRGGADYIRPCIPPPDFDISQIYESAVAKAGYWV